jgi:hypothetical protein
MMANVKSWRRQMIMSGKPNDNLSALIDYWSSGDYIDVPLNLQEWHLQAWERWQSVQCVLGEDE